LFPLPVVVAHNRNVAATWCTTGGKRVTSAVQSLLDTFDALPEVERHEAVVELLRRVEAPAELPDDALAALADDVFCELDAQEAADAGY
jgi:hypothetical protein